MKVADEAHEFRAVDECNLAALREVLRLAGERAGGDDNAVVGLLSTHDSEQFPHGPDAHLPCLPLLALDQRFLAVLAQNQIDPAVASGIARLFDAVALMAEQFARLYFKVLPR